MVLSVKRSRSTTAKTSQKQPESEDQQDIEEIRAYGKLNSRLKLVT